VTQRTPGHGGAPAFRPLGGDTNWSAAGVGTGGGGAGGGSTIGAAEVVSATDDGVPIGGAACLAGGGVDCATAEDDCDENDGDEDDGGVTGSDDGPGPVALSSRLPLAQAPTTVNAATTSSTRSRRVHRFRGALRCGEPVLSIPCTGPIELIRGVADPAESR
jgi:hypothetical protein